MEYEITFEALKKGYEKGAVKLIDCPDFDDVVCQIGEYWFYFAGFEGEGHTAEDYKKEHTEDEIITYILCALEDICMNDGEDEYNYYCAVLIEAGCA